MAQPLPATFSVGLTGPLAHEPASPEDERMEVPMPDNADWWQNRPWRLVQTNLRGIDMLDISAERVVSDLRAFAANILMINAAGIIASYPTRLPFHFQSPYLKGDSLQQIIGACHAADIRVIARTDFSKVRRPIYERYPHWAYVSPAGQIVDYNGDVHVCLNSEYQQQRMFDILHELLSTHDFDGIFFNMGGYQTRDYSGNYYGICHCEACKRRFREMFDLPLPVKEDMEDPLFRKYVQFKRQTVREHNRRVYEFVQKLRPGLCVANHQEFRRGFIRQESNTAIDRPLPHWQYSGSENTKWAAASYPTMVSSNTTVDFIDFPYRHVAVAPHQQALRLAQSLANGGALDYYIIGRLDNHADRSGFAPIKEVFHYHAANERAYQDLRSVADVALLNGPNANGGEFRGWFRFLAEGHFLFDVLMSEPAVDLPWDKYRAVVLPDLQGISDALAKKIDAFVHAGGTLISAGRSGWRDENFEPRERPALASLGIEQVLRIRPDMRSSYFRLDDKTGFSRFNDTDLIYMDGMYIHCAYAAAARGRMKLIPPHNFGPPERCYYTLETDHPAFIVNPHGKGRAIHIPWLPGALFHPQGYPNTSDFAADLLGGIAGLTPVGGNVPPMVEVTVQEKRDGSALLVHLVNGSGHFGNSFFAPVAMSDVQVQVPCPRRPRSVRSLVRGAPCEHTWRDGRLTMRVEKLELFEAIVVG